MRDWLKESRTKLQDLDNAVVAFLRALFEVARDRIKAIRQEDGSTRYAAFAELMGAQTSFWEHSTYRVDFYAEVVSLATQVCSVFYQ